MLNLIVSDCALDDIQSIVNYYDKIDQRLSERFLDELDHRFQGIEKLPEGFQKRYKSYRIAFLPRFPFGVFYEINDQVIMVIAVLHNKQSMSKWLKIRS